MVSRTSPRSTGLDRSLPRRGRRGTPASRVLTSRNPLLLLRFDGLLLLRLAARALLLLLFHDPPRSTRLDVMCSPVHQPPAGGGRAPFTPRRVSVTQPRTERAPHAIDLELCRRNQVLVLSHATREPLQVGTQDAAVMRVEAKAQEGNAVAHRETLGLGRVRGEAARDLGTARHGCCARPVREP